MAGRTIDAGLKLLDRQIVDVDGKMLGNVDDLELTWPDEPGRAPYVSAILSGPGALGHRLGGRMGRLLEAVFQRLHPQEDPRPQRISFGLVKEIGPHVALTTGKESLAPALIQSWVRDHVISRIPGADRAPE